MQADQLAATWPVRRRVSKMTKRVPVYDFDETLGLLADWEALAQELTQVYLEAPFVLPRVHHTLPGAEAPSLLMMPASDPDLTITKILHIGSAKHGRPGIQGVCPVLDTKTGETLAILDGGAMTLARTAAVSALAAQRLAGPGPHRHLILGAGELTKPFAQAFQALLTISTTSIWARRSEAAQAVAAKCEAEGTKVEVAEDLALAIPEASIVSTLTGSSKPLFDGQWLADASHLDLVGSYTAQMREVDTAALIGAQIYAEPKQEALEHAGELAQPIAAGELEPSVVVGDLADLVRCDPDRPSVTMRTVFKSVGASRMDLAAARLAMRVAGKVGG
jgi:ornithine cyclodeaminase/alanine dehydrogenase-like protein (mu-crystallin family)